MTAKQFIDIQDKILRLKGKDLAELIGAEASSISGYRNGRTIPAYIEEAMKLRGAIAIGEVTFPISLKDLLSISRLAESKGQTVEDYIVNLLRSDLSTEGRTVQRPAIPPHVAAPARAPLR